MKTKQKLTAILIVIMAAAITSSCTKEEYEDISRPQVVTYAINCKDCVVCLEDDKWNGEKNQTFNVQGSFNYSFTNYNETNSVTVKIQVSSLIPYEQNVYIEIKENKYGGREFKKVVLGNSEFSSELTLRLTK